MGWGGVPTAGQGLGGVQGLRFGGVGGRDTALRHVQNDALWGGGGYPPELAWWTEG